MAPCRRQLPRRQGSRIQAFRYRRTASERAVQSLPHRFLHRRGGPGEPGRPQMLPLHRIPPQGAVPHNVRGQEGPHLPHTGEPVPRYTQPSCCSAQRTPAADHLASSAGHASVQQDVSRLHGILQRPVQRSFGTRPSSFPGLPERDTAPREGRRCIPGQPGEPPRNRAGRKSLQIPPLHQGGVRAQIHHAEVDGQALLPPARVLPAPRRRERAPLQLLLLAQERRIPHRCRAPLQPAFTPLYRRRPRAPHDESGRSRHGRFLHRAQGRGFPQDQRPHARFNGGRSVHLGRR